MSQFPAVPSHLGTITGNLFWVFAYTITAIPIAMLGPEPLVAVTAMALSRFRGAQPPPATVPTGGAVCVRRTRRAKPQHV